MSRKIRFCVGESLVAGGPPGTAAEPALGTAPENAPGTLPGTRPGTC